MTHIGTQRCMMRLVTLDRLVGWLVSSSSRLVFVQIKKMMRSAPVITYTYDVRILQRHLVLVQVREGGYDLRTRTEHSGQRAREGTHTRACASVRHSRDG